MFKKTPISYVLRITSTLFPAQKPLVFSGPGSTQKLADFMSEGGTKRPLLVTDRFLLEHGMLEDVLAFLKGQGCEVSIFDGIIPNPTFAVVEAGLTISRANDCDSVLAIGGGSAIDAAKVIAAAHPDPRPLNKLVGTLKFKTAPLPFYVAPTTSGSGSETTFAAVISETDTHKKRFFVSPKLLPFATALDPDLLKSLPPAMSAAVGMDALTHAIEAFISTNRFDESDRDARMAIALLIRYLPQAVADGADLTAREKVAQASFLAGAAFTKSSLGYVHAISHQISAQYNTPHGLANAVLLPRVLRFNLPAVIDRLAQLEQMLAPQERSTEAEAAARFVTRIDALSDELGIPDTIADLRWTDFAKITQDALAEARISYAVPRVMRAHHVEKILSAVQIGRRDLAFD
ncbi:MAG: iron-containing alcohol dehydrogenase [Mangrovicoccus sp.]|nr:iron-containing alcohol dehydrogenase [Mangrovicoccus sp.]